MMGGSTLPDNAHDFFFTLFPQGRGRDAHKMAEGTEATLFASGQAAIPGAAMVGGRGARRHRPPPRPPPHGPMRRGRAQPGTPARTPPAGWRGTRGRIGDASCTALLCLGAPAPRGTTQTRRMTVR